MLLSCREERPHQRQRQRRQRPPNAPTPTPPPPTPTPTATTTPTPPPPTPTPTPTPTATPSTASCKRSLTIDHTKVPSTQSNFTVLVSLTDPALKTVANGGHVANANGYDIGFYADSGGTVKLKWEVEKYDGTTGNLIAWVKIPSVSSSTDTVFYLMYGDSSINTNQSDPPNTWDSNFKGVWHMNDSAANTTIRESTATGANGTNNANTSSKTATGQIGKALSYNGSTDGSFAAINLSATNIVTLSFWMKWTTNANDDDLAFEYTPNYNTNAGGFIADWNSSSLWWRKIRDGHGQGKWHLLDRSFHQAVSWGMAPCSPGVQSLSEPTNKVYVDGSLQTLNNRLTQRLQAWAIFPIARSISCPGRRARSMPPGRWTKSGCRQSNAMPTGSQRSTTTKARPEHLSPWAARVALHRHLHQHRLQLVNGQ